MTPFQALCIGINKMGKIIETKINRFENGIITDPRLDIVGVSQMIKNFDAYTYPVKLIPHRSLVSGDSGASTSQKQNFCIVLRTGTTYSLYALGVKSGATTAEVLYKDLTTSASNDLGDAGWATPTANQSATGTLTSFKLFVYYKLANLIIGARDSTHLWAFSPSGSAWSDTWQTLTYTNIAQGIVHSVDDILYIPYDNKIAKYNHTGTSFVAPVLTLPSQYVITSICEYGNYLAIACAPLSGIGNSRVFLWDRDSTITTLSESIDWGEGNVINLEEIEGMLVGVSNLTSATLQNITINNKIVIRYYNGDVATILTEVYDEAGGANFVLSLKQKINQALYTYFVATIDGTTHRGIWRIGRNKNGKFTLTLDRTITNTEGNTPCKAFIKVGDYYVIAYTSADVYYVNKTDSSTNYSTGTYESQIFNGGDASLKKKLVGISATFEPLATAGEVKVYYKIDAESSYTLIFDETTDNAISHSSINIESSGANLPDDYKEIQFKIESLGGAVITSLTFKEEILGKRIYE